MEAKKAILRTLAYADIFAYPLTIREIERFLITPRKVDQNKIQKELDQMKKKRSVCFKGGYYFLAGREGIIATRRKKERFSQDKLKKVRRVARWLRLIPTVKLVGATGSLAMRNADLEDDLDLLIVSSQDRLWLTRLLVIFLVELVDQRRKPRDKNVKDKVCLNMFLAEDHLKVPQKEQDLYSAHEVVQLMVLEEKDGCYQKFIGANLWSKKYLANWK